MGANVEPLPEPGFICSAPHASSVKRGTIERKVMSESSKTHPIDAKIARLTDLLAAADKVCEYAYHSTAGCGLRDKDNCECGFTKAQKAYQSLKGKADAK